MQVCLFDDCVIMETASVYINIPVPFESVDLMERKKRISCKYSNVSTFFPVDNMESATFIFYPLEPINDTALL